MAITDGYATLNDVKAALRMGTAAHADDALIELAVESASRLIDADCDRVFYASGTAVARVFTPANAYQTLIDDAISITSVETDDDADGTFETTWAATDYRKAPANSLAGGAAWPTTSLHAIGDYLFPVWNGETTVRVTGQWGFGTAVPTDIKNATVLQSLRLVKRFDSPLGVAGFGELGALRVSRTDPDVYAMIRRYKRSTVGLG